MSELTEREFEAQHCVRAVDARGDVIAVSAPVDGYVGRVTDAQILAYQTLRSATEANFQAALEAFRATVEGSENIPFQALYEALKFIGNVAANGGGSAEWPQREARKLLGWT